jgi:hypothetical protein
MHLKQFDWKQKRKATDQQVYSIKNQYYENVSAGLGVMQVILYFTLFAFVILSFVGNTNLITYRNFYYFFKDLDASADSIDVFKSDSMTYPTDASQYFTLYRGGLAVIGDRSVSAFTATGRQTVSESIQYRNPMAEGRGRYLMVYEMGGTQYSLYNSYTQLYADKTDYPINGAAVSDSGVYAILSSSDSFSSVVSLYNDNFALINRYNKNSFVTDVAIDGKGRLVALLSAEPRGGAFETALELYAPGETEAKKRISLGEGMAYSCVFTAPDVIAVSFPDSIVFVSSDGKLLNKHDFQGESPVLADVGDDGAAILLRASAISAKNHLIVFDKYGKILYNEDIDAQADAIARFSDSVFLMTDSEILRLSVDTGVIASVKHQTDQRCILAVSEDEVLICSPQKAEYIKF